MTTSFLRLIKMIIAPLVFSTLTVGVGENGRHRLDSARGRQDPGLVHLRIADFHDHWDLHGSVIQTGCGIACTPGRRCRGPRLPRRPGLMDMLDHIIPSSFVQRDGRQRNTADRAVFNSYSALAAASLGNRVSGLIDAIEQIAHHHSENDRLHHDAGAAPPCSRPWPPPFSTQGLGVLLVYAKFIGSFYLALLVLWGFLSLALFASIGTRARHACSVPSARPCSSPSRRRVPRRHIRALSSVWSNSGSARASPPSSCRWAIRSISMARRCTARLAACCSSAQIFHIDLSLHQQIAHACSF